MNQDCTFCKIISGAIHSRVLYRNAHSIAFLPLQLNVRGHIVVAPINHSADIFHIPDSDLSELMKTSQFLAAHLKKQLGADGINILHASGETAQQSAPHFHLHLLPRFKDDNLDTWPSLPVWSGDLDELLHTLRVENK